MLTRLIQPTQVRSQARVEMRSNVGQLRILRSPVQLARFAAAEYMTDDSNPAWPNTITLYIELSIRTKQQPTIQFCSFYTAHSMATEQYDQAK